MDKNPKNYKKGSYKEFILLAAFDNLKNKVIPQSVRDFSDWSIMYYGSTDMMKKTVLQTINNL